MHVSTYRIVVVDFYELLRIQSPQVELLASILSIVLLISALTSRRIPIHEHIGQANDAINAAWKALALAESFSSRMIQTSIEISS